MVNAKMIVTETTFKEMPENERSWLLYNTMTALDKRVEKIEGRKFWDSTKSFMGGLIGGAAAAFGIRLGS